MAQGAAGRVTRRGFTLGALGAAGVMGAMACGPAGQQPAAGRPPGQLSGKIVFLARGNAVEQQGQTEVYIPTFKNVAPNVEVVHEITGGSNEYNEKLLTLAATGSLPDVWGFGMNYMMYWARGMVADLTPLIQRDKFDLDQFLPGLPDKFKVRGKQYGIPQLTTFGTLMFYNKNLFDAAGLKYPPADWEDRTWTYDLMLDHARKLTKNAGAPEAVYGLSYGPQLPTMPPWNFGGDAFMPEHYKEGIAPNTLLDSPPSIAAHEFVQDVRWRDHVSPQTGKDPTTGIGFMQGRYAMEVSGGWNFWNYNKITDFKWGAAAIPWKANNKNTAYNDFWELSKESQNRDAAWAFIKHVASPEIQRQYTQLTGTPPTTKAAIDAWYKRYEDLFPRAELEKVTQGAIDPKRSQESPDHLFIDWYRFDEYYRKEVSTPLSRNEGKARDLITRAKPGYDALVKEVYEQWKGKTPS